MDFGFYPPEVNSGRMYTGPGSGPMLAAAQAWGSLADELYTNASGYQSVVSELTSGTWSGPSSTSMSTAAASYVEWLSVTAAQAEQTAAQARAAAAGYEAAFAMTVPPPEIAANRSLLAVLVATNFLGQNTPAIAATEAHYAAMWAQDAVAMYGYAGSSAAASALTPFAAPHHNTDSGASAGQAAAVSQASGSAAGNAQSAISVVPQALSATAAPAQTDPLSTLANLISVFFSAPTDLATFFFLVPADALAGPADLPFVVVGTGSGTSTDKTISGWNGDTPFLLGSAPAPVTEFPPTLANLPPGTLPAPTVSAGMAEADTIGALSVPSNWTVAAPEVRQAAFTTPLTGANAAAGPAAEAGAASTFNQMGIGGMAGQAMAGSPVAGDSQESSAPARLTGRVAGAPADGQTEASPAPRTVVTGVAAAIRDIARQRAQGRLSEQEYTAHKKRLLEISSGHRPLA